MFKSDTYKHKFRKKPNLYTYIHNISEKKFMHSPLNLHVNVLIDMYTHMYKHVFFI